jgi:hypothetical protein
MTRKPTSDEQFGVIEDGDEPPTTELNELFDHHGYQIYEIIDDEEEDGG